MGILFSNSRYYLTKTSHPKQILDCESRCQTFGYNNGNTPGWDYSGNVAKTRSGLTCQFWNTQTLHKHDQPRWNHNYCRNPSSEDGGVWCYTTDPDVKWEYCDVPGLSFSIHSLFKLTYVQPATQNSKKQLKPKRVSFDKSLKAET